ncbi:MAG: hypothetical protein H8M99_08785 [Gloeobacteraceae cyanobacterium ES-bin-144]|nr:hypothetical protein [Verrucomicrobiales bacterium]
MKAFQMLLAAVVLCAQAAGAYQLHEWGTFTTVAGSDGILLSGLQREEETLPEFVHAHFGFENGQTNSGEELAYVMETRGYPAFPSQTKGLGKRPVSGVTVKMETPVIYFYSEKALRVKVKVDFNGGTISQWYPNRSGGEVLPVPPPSEDPKNKPVPVEKWLIDFSNPYQGGIEWDVNVLSPEESRSSLTFKPRDSVNWMRARVPEANVLRTDAGETENYLFYRGVGNFKPGLVTRVSSDEVLHLHNQTGADIPFFLVFQRHEGKVSWSVRKDGLKADGIFDLAESQLKQAEQGFPTEIYQSMKNGLVGCGLLESEANAMVQTWWTSYFESEGLRVFWVLPGVSTDRILPLRVNPQPDRIVRVIVGRSEVLRPRLEKEMLSKSRVKGDAAELWNSFVETDRFGLAIQERMNVLDQTLPEIRHQGVIE